MLRAKVGSEHFQMVSIIFFPSFLFLWQVKEYVSRAEHLQKIVTSHLLNAQNEQTINTLGKFMKTPILYACIEVQYSYRKFHSFFLQNKFLMIIPSYVKQWYCCNKQK